VSIYFVYILETISKNGKKSFYTGYTKDLLRRKNEHKEGRGAKYCRGKQTIELKYFETFIEKKDALKREREIKSFSREKKLELVNNFINS